jgi:succinate dehydrogenase hydrophobic anchor subunit
MNIPVFGQIHAVSFLVPVITGIIRFSKLRPAMRVLTVLCILACIDIAAQLLVGFWGMKNYFVSDCYRLIEVSLFCTVFFLSLASRRPRMTLGALGILFALFWTVYMSWFYDRAHINSILAMVSRVFLLVLSLVTLQALQEDEKTRLVDRPVFWVAAGVAVYACGTLLLLGLSNQLLKLGLPYFVFAWHINWFLLIVANLLYTKGLLCKSQV